MILVINNRDSFVYNLVRYIAELGYETRVEDAQTLTLEDVEAIAPDAILLSPGPGTPQMAGITVPVITAYAGKLPILGVCLGHQAIATAFGWQVGRAQVPAHGHGVPITHAGTGLFKGLPNPLEVGLYHSLIVKEAAGDAPPTGLQVDARSAAGEIMAISKPDARLYGVQFHPESILTEHGHDLLSNFLELAQTPQTVNQI